MPNHEVSLHVDGLRLAGEIYLPESPGVHPGLCFCHGIPAAQYEPGDRRYAALAERFRGEGFAVAVFNFRGAGRSEGDLDISGWTRDLSAVVGHLSEQPGVDRRRLALMGSSAGAAVAAYVAATDQRVSHLALMACPADFDQLVDPARAKPFVDYLKKIGLIRDMAFPPSLERWVDGFNTVRPISCIARVSPRPVLIIHGEGDDMVPVEHARRLYAEAREPKELVIVPGAGHRLRLEDAAVNAALSWLRRSLLH